MDNNVSDVVSVSESSTAATKKNESGDAMMKKKLKVLKQAFKEERELKDKVEKDLSKAREEIQTLKSQFNEKDKKYQELYKEKMNLEDSLLSDMLKNKNAEKQEPKKKIQPISTLAGPVTPEPTETKKE